MNRYKVSETEVLQSCLSFLEIQGIYAWRNNTGAVKNGKRFIRFGYPGSSDILGICPDGRFLAIECKNGKGGKTSDLQIDFQNQITSNNGLAFIVSSVDDLISKLKFHGVIK